LITDLKLRFLAHQLQLLYKFLLHKGGKVFCLGAYKSVANSHLLATNHASVLLVDADKIRATMLVRELESMGYQIVAKLRTANNLFKAIDSSSPDIIVVGIDLPDDEMLQKIASLQSLQPHPVIMFAEQDTPQIIQKVIKAGVSAFVVDDIQAERIQSIVNIAIARFQEEQGLRQELTRTKNQLEERKIVDKAKGLLMSKRGLDEDQAYKMLRKMAMDKGKTLGAVAENIVEVMQLIAE
jgi:two-component system, response regulator / RNA-binding antiterminator